jgi:hypothetical protein
VGDIATDAAASSRRSAKRGSERSLAEIEGVLIASSAVL